MFTHEKEEKCEELKLSRHIDNMPPIEITEENVLKKLNAIKTDKSPGPDQLHSRVLFVVVVVDIFFCPIRARFQSCVIKSRYILLDINVHC